MTLLQAIILGAIQGFTEFIPISSSGHLVIAHSLLGLENGGLAFDVALHFGTLLALVTFFKNEIGRLSVAFFKKSRETNLARMLALATLPAVVAGMLLENAAESAFRSIRLVSFNLLIVGIVMLLAERYSKKLTKKDVYEVRSGQAIGIGVAQAAALVPGVSRSGATITAGLFSGLDRVSATRFSFLLGIPITFGAILKVFLDGNLVSNFSGQMDVVLTGVIMSFATGLFAIKFLLKFLAKNTLAIFAYYRIILALVILTASMF